MADRGSMPPKFPVVTDDQSGLEPVPQPGIESAHPDWDRGYGWHEQQQNGYYNPGTEAPELANPPQDAKPRILGLSVRAFWAVVIILVVILAAAIGGGIGGGLAASHSHADASSVTASSSASSSSSSPSPSSSGTSTLTTQTGTASNTATTTTSSVSGGVSPAPSDACPSINGTAYTPNDGTGKAISVKSGAPAQSFVRLCSTNFPSGASYGNPGIYDLMKLYLATLEDCITACAMYNVNYENNRASGMGDPAAGTTGFCRAVSIVKNRGDYCYLKNDTATNNTFGSPSTYSSAVLLTGALAGA